MKFSQTATIDNGEDSSTRAFYLPRIDGPSRTYFVRLSLDDSSGNRVSSNFYWLSTQADVFDWQAPDYPYAQLKTYADLTDLQSLPPVQLTASWTSEQVDLDRVEHVVVRNPSASLTFFVHLTVLKGKDGGDIAPAYWSDNYFELLPGGATGDHGHVSKEATGQRAVLWMVDGGDVAVNSTR